MEQKEETARLPLTGIRVLELSQAVMGPTAGMVLADMGADVIRIEPTPQGDWTRHIKGFGTGFFPTFNRNKRSIILNLKSPEGMEILDKLIKTADVLIENYAPGTIERLGFGYDRVSKLNPRLVFCSLKGFMPGPYENRPALDEVCQMMGGLAYMTGPVGRPLRAGASVLDIMGGSYGVIGILTALYDRERTGRGQQVLATLFESVALLMAQNMAVAAITGKSRLPCRSAAAPGRSMTCSTPPMEAKYSWARPVTLIGGGFARASVMTIWRRTPGWPPTTAAWTSGNGCSRSSTGAWQN